MSVTRRAWVVLIAALLPATANHAIAQAPGDRLAIGVATLSDLDQRWGRNNPSKQALLFDPTVVRGWWENGIHRDSVSSVRVRDSAEVAELVAALHGVPVTPEMMRDCGGTPVKFTCTLVARNVFVIALSDPRITGDSATVLLRDGPPYFMGTDRPGGGRAGSIGLIRLVRDGGRWTVRCSAGAGTDFTPPASRVEQECAANALQRGRGG